jgi:hypothetical protein
MLNPSTHKCPPSWEVWAEGEERSHAGVIYANTAERAVEKWAEREDSYGGYEIVGGDAVTVSVAKYDQKIPEQFTVTGEAVPQYRAERVMP